MNRLNEKRELIFMLTQVVGPLETLKHTVDANEQMRIIGRFLHDAKNLMDRFRAFCFNEPNHSYQWLYEQFHHSLNDLMSSGPARPMTAERLLADAPRRYAELLATVQSFPVVPESQIFDAETPFAAYCFIRNLCLVSRDRIDLFDRYLDYSVFHRYLFGAEDNVKITLVTLPQAEQRSSKDLTRYREFIDVSGLFALERGPNKYALVTLPGSDFHDRWLRCDNQLYALGGSVKDLDQRFTISKLESTKENMQKVDSAIAGGTVVFGPTQPTHP